ncbi:MAG TPA: ATP-dependent DNA helicase RecG [Egibacteraceae bacterium]|nr:ATP-dependent DNA helicase RecG [Egibacteraceae bacterium]
MDAQAWLDADVSAIDGVSGRAAGVLRAAFEIRTVRDLLEHYPRAYRDIGALQPLAQAPLGEPVTIVGAITGWSVMRPGARGRGGGRGRRGLVIAKATVVDDGGDRVEVPFFNQEWRPRQHPPGTRVAVSGVLERFRAALQLKNAKLVVLGADGASAPADVDADVDGDVDEELERIQPAYPATDPLPSWRIARFVGSALEQLEPLEDFLPAELRLRHTLIDLDSAVRGIHRPRDLDQATAARDRLVYDELLCLQVGLQQRRERLERQAAGVENTPAGTGGAAARFIEFLSFNLTGAQAAALAEIGADLARPKPMHRLLQGDVGSGKTVVAAWAMLSALDNGRQAVLMAPTEILAEQHFRTFSEMLAPLGVNAPAGPRLELLTGSVTAKKLRGLLAEVAVGDVQLLIGTHALLEERVSFADLGVVVIDEQHRFGVEHRTRLRDKRSDGRWPDVLVMTATPIPRSLALTVYGDLDVTVLDELPPGRQQIVTQVIPSGSTRRRSLYGFIRERIAAGERAYVVCPLIDKSETLDLAAAEEVYRHLSGEVFADFDVGLVHGRLPGAERERVMEAFRAGEIQVLVATTVIEVGVDVPEATIMVVEDAQRFGISQLHQLRGRVGRASARSYCVLFAGDAVDEAAEAGTLTIEAGAPNPRLLAVGSTTDGFALAERDLELRGEGSLFDTRQSGLPDLKLAKLIKDYDWVVQTRADARDLVERDPALDGFPQLRAEVRRRYGEERLAALEAG